MSLIWGWAAGGEEGWYHFGMLKMCAVLLLVLGPQVPQDVAPEGPEAAAIPDYEVGAEDILKVTVYGHQDLAHTVIVQPDGTFMFPLIGDVKAGDLTIEELERKLTTLLAAYVRNPQVTVSVVEYRSQVVRVVGAVAKPGTYPIAKSATLVEMLSTAGPLTPEAGTTAVVVRPRGKVDAPPEVGEDGGLEEEVEGDVQPPLSPNVVIEIDLREIDAGILEKNLTLLPNDTVIVPKAPKVFVSGEVENPGAYPYSPGLTARQLISMGGGLTRRGSDKRLRVVRQVGTETEEKKTKNDLPVRPGDTLIVKAKLF